jgi:hypothetical protein
MSDRGMKKWAPYASVIEQKNVVTSTKKNRLKQTKPQLSTEAAEAINQTLLQSPKAHVSLTYFYEGERVLIQTFVKSINFDTHTLITKDGHFDLKNILSIEIISL